MNILSESKIRKIANICLLAFLGLFTAAHITKTNLNPIENFYSEYGLGEYRLFFFISLIFYATAIFLIAYRKHSSKVTYILYVYGILILLVAIFPTNTTDSFKIDGMIHSMAAISSFLFVVLSSFVSEKSNYYIRVWLTIAVISIYVVPAEFQGLAQRISIISNLAWITFLNNKA